MLPVFALVGRPNVGKSTLFNCLTRSRDALVFDTPGITRDRLYGQGRYATETGDQPFIVIDTGGISADESAMDKLMQQQAWQATADAQVIIWLVDAQEGLTPVDAQLSQRLRELGKPVIVAVNKVDGKVAAVVCSEFYQLGWEILVPIAASHNQGIYTLLQQAFALLPAPTEALETPVSSSLTAGIQVAVIGRPNVGKSTLINRLLGEERVVVFDAPGTTRDSIFIPFTRREQSYTLIDTAGVRRKHKISDVLEKFSVVKTLQAVATAQVIIFLLNAQEGITDQDLSLIQFVLDAGRGLIIAINKWDGLTPYQRQQITTQVDRRLAFVDFAPCLYISAQHGTGVGKLWEYVQKIYVCETTRHSTAKLTKILHTAVSEHAPPMIHGRRIKLKYAHLGGILPPKIVIHGNQTGSLTKQYQRYLINQFRTALKLVGTPVQLVLKSSDNPYQ